MKVDLQILPAKNGLPTLRAELESGRSVFLHSSYDPEREARQWAERAEFGPNDVVVLFGCGAGYAAGALRKRLSRNNHLLILDPLAPQIDRGLSPLREALSDPRIHRTADFTEFRAAYGQIESACWKGLSLVRLPAYEKLFPEELKEAAQWVARQANTMKMHRDTVFSTARLWQRNLFQNLVQLHDSGAVSAAFGTFIDKPAIIVSAGPSLTKNMHLLERAQDQALIIATGTAARLLALEGLPYHLVVSVDPRPVNWTAHFQGIAHGGVTLVYDVTTTPEIVNSHPGPKSAFYSLPDCTWLDRFFSRPFGLLKAGGSVANVAFDLAVQLEADPVILIGQDLAYTDGLSNAPGTYEEQFVHKVPQGWFEREEEELSRLAQDQPDLAHLFKRGRRLVPGKAGELVWTDRALLGFLTRFEEEIAAMGESRQVIDATEGGALIRGTRVETFSRTLERYCSEQQKQAIEETIWRLGRPVRSKGRGLIDHLEAELKEIEVLRMDCSRGLRAIGEGRTEEARKSECRVVDRLDRVKRILHFALVPTLVRLQELPTVGTADWTTLRPWFFEHLGGMLTTERHNLLAAIRSLHTPGPEP